jgi:integrase
MLQRKLRQEEQARLEAIRKQLDVTQTSTKEEEAAVSPLPTAPSIKPETVLAETALAIPKRTQRLTVRKRDRLDPRKVRIGDKIFWQVDLGSEVRGDGKRYRFRKTFASHEEAETFASIKKIERTNRGTAGLALSDRLRGEAVEADRLLSPYGVSILQLAREYVDRKEQSAKSETVSNALPLFLHAKKGDGMRPRYLGDLRDRLRRFADSFGERKVSDISPAEIDNWLRNLGLAPLTRNTFSLRLSVFFEFARQRGWIQSNPMGDVPKAKVTGKPPGILTPEQAARLLENASQETLPVFALGLFAGLRSAEIERLQWRHIRWDERFIEVPALSSKTAARRLVAMQPNLALWLAPYRGKQGPICPPDHYRRMIDDKQRAGITGWPSNAMRHSYASYHLAMFKDAPALSLELGHVTPQIVFAHYREVVRPSEAERFWKIAPAIDAEQKLAVVA